jgi:hypothetical protein
MRDLIGSDLCCKQQRRLVAPARGVPSQVAQFSAFSFQFQIKFTQLSAGIGDRLLTGKLLLGMFFTSRRDFAGTEVFLLVK